MNYWIYQGNPKTYDIDTYLATHPYIYWNSPNHRQDVNVGDYVFLWRAHKNSGLVAIGQIVEAPIPLKDIKFPDLLGNSLWSKDESIPSPDELKVGIKILETRLSESTGMLTREMLKLDSIINGHRIITNPTGTIFKIEENRGEHLLDLWGVNQSDDELSLLSPSHKAIEGKKKLVTHYQRERSSDLRQLKIDDFKVNHSSLHCEICNWDFEDHYPIQLAKDYIEVHHTIPLAKLEPNTPTELKDLMLVCSNCHRMIHRTKDAEKNLELIKTHFKEADLR